MSRYSYIVMLLMGCPCLGGREAAKPDGEGDSARKARNRHRQTVIYLIREYWQLWARTGHWFGSVGGLTAPRVRDGYFFVTRRPDPRHVRAPRSACVSAEPAASGVKAERAPARPTKGTSCPVPPQSTGNPHDSRSQ